MTYALGRGIEYYDMPAVRKIVQDARANNFRFLVDRARRREERAVPDEGGQMRFITKKHLSRRTFLRGMGVTMSLPLLESMVPAQTPLAKTAANPQIRLGLCFIPHGAVMATGRRRRKGR